jgi:hypothetical protein
MIIMMTKFHVQSFTLSLVNMYVVSYALSRGKIGKSQNSDISVNGDEEASTKRHGPNGFSAIESLLCRHRWKQKLEHGRIRFAVITMNPFDKCPKPGYRTRFRCFTAGERLIDSHFVVGWVYLDCCRSVFMAAQPSIWPQRMPREQARNPDLAKLSSPTWPTPICPTSGHSTSVKQHDQVPQPGLRKTAYPKARYTFLHTRFSCFQSLVALSWQHCISRLTQDLNTELCLISPDHH